MFVIGTEFIRILNTAGLDARLVLSHVICSAEMYCGLSAPRVDGRRSLRQSSTKTSTVLPQRAERQMRRGVDSTIGACSKNVLNALSSCVLSIDSGLKSFVTSWSSHVMYMPV